MTSVLNNAMQQGRNFTIPSSSQLSSGNSSNGNSISNDALTTASPASAQAQLHNLELQQRQNQVLAEQQQRQAYQQQQVQKQQQIEKQQQQINEQVQQQILLSLQKMNENMAILVTQNKSIAESLSQVLITPEKSTRRYAQPQSLSLSLSQPQPSRTPTHSQTQTPSQTESKVEVDDYVEETQFDASESDRVRFTGFVEEKQGGKLSEVLSFDDDDADDDNDADDDDADDDANDADDNDDNDDDKENSQSTGNSHNDVQRDILGKNGMKNRRVRGRKRSRGMNILTQTSDGEDKRNRRKVNKADKIKPGQKKKGSSPRPKNTKKKRGCFDFVSDD